MSTEESWSQISRAAGLVVETVMRASEIPGSDTLIDQLQSAVARNEAAWILDIKVDAESQRAEFPDGPVPVRAFVPNETDYRGEILIWVTGGLLSGLEYAWVTDEPPTAWPTPDEIQIVRK